MKSKLFKLFSLGVTIAVLLLMLGACESELPSACPDAKFTVNANGDSTEYTITADFNGIEELVYGWYVNDDLVETEELDEHRNNSFDFSLAPGTYNVCIKAESEECGGSVEFCLDVTIKADPDTDCPHLSFDKEQISSHKYLFEAGFEGMDTIAYVWYVDGDSIESEPLDGERHHKFDYEFEAGTHTVCIKAKTDSCGELKFCKEIVIDGSSPCPVLSFEVDEEWEPGTYKFFANFEGKETTQYKWYIGEEAVDSENFEGTETDHKLYWQFEPGTYTVCIENMATDICEATHFCKEIIVEEAPCPELYFRTVPKGGGEYKFYAEFAGKEHTQYKWYIGEDLVDTENMEGSETNHYLIKHLEPGTYTICIESVGTDNCEATEYCETITVEEAPPCVELSYTAEADTTGMYTFTADFAARDSVTYIWKIYLGEDLQISEAREAGSDADHSFSYQFEAGVIYTVCLKQDGCGETAVCHEYPTE